jgi:hypothetical protein
MGFWLRLGMGRRAYGNNNQRRTYALRDLIKAKNDQIEEELSNAHEHQERQRLAAMLGF